MTLDSMLNLTMQLFLNWFYKCNMLKVTNNWGMHADYLTLGKQILIDVNDGFSASFFSGLL